MSTAKEDVRQILEKLSDDATLEDIQYHLYVRQKIESALAEVDREEAVPHDKVEERMKKWLVE